MTKIEIPSTKRPFKAVISVLTIILLVSATMYFNLINSVIFHFVWWKAIILAIVVIAFIIFLKGLLEFIFTGSVKSVAEMIGEDTIQFYSITPKGKKMNKSEHKLSDIKRIYILKSKSLKGLIQDRSIQYKLVKPNPFLTEDIKILPDLFEATESDMNKIILFVHSQRPEIEMGYDGIWKG